MSNIRGIAMADCTVQLWYNKQRIKINGSVSLYLQIIVGGEHNEIKLNGLEWPAKKFDWEKKALKQRFKDDAELVTYNAMIERERSKYWAVVMKYLKAEKTFSLSDIFKGVNLYTSGVMFCAFMERGIRDRQKTDQKKDMIKASTARVQKSSLKGFRTFLGCVDIDILMVDGDLLEKFAQHLRKSLTENTVWVRIQHVKSYLTYAARQKVAINPDFKSCIVTPDEPDPTWLEEDEIKSLLDLYWGTIIPMVKISTEQRRNLRAFLFACFTGLRISDLSRWNKDWIKDDCLSFVPQKRRKSAKPGKPILIPIIPLAKEFINDLTAETFELPDEQVYNRGLKLLASMASINKDVTSHVARHTFATWLAIDGVPVLVISKLLGHKSIQTTMIYIHIAEAYLAREMMKMQRRFGMRPVDNLGKSA